MALKHSVEACGNVQDAGDKAKDIIDSGKDAVCSFFQNSAVERCVSSCAIECLSWQGLCASCWQGLCDLYHLLCQPACCLQAGCFAGQGRSWLCKVCCWLCWQQGKGPCWTGVSRTVYPHILLCRRAQTCICAVFAMRLRPVRQRPHVRGHKIMSNSWDAACWCAHLSISWTSRLNYQRCCTRC